MTNTVELNQTQVQVLQEVLAQANLNGKPIVLSFRDSENWVVLKASRYEQMIEAIEEAETVAAIQEGWEAAQAGRMRPAREVLEDLRNEFGFADPPVKPR